MNTKNIDGALVGIVAVVIQILCTLWGGWYIGMDELKKEAIQNGVAKYVVNEKTGNTKFVWNVGNVSTNKD